MLSRYFGTSSGVIKKGISSKSLEGVGYFFLQYYVLRKLMKHPELQQKDGKKEKIELTEDGRIRYRGNSRKRTE